MWDWYLVGKRMLTPAPRPAPVGESYSTADDLLAASGLVLTPEERAMLDGDGHVKAVEVVSDR